ncbi:MAG: peptidylprolyl isomerase [Hyphomicrobiaceae bacterium]
MSIGASPRGCAIKPVITAKQKTVSVNGVVISRAAIARETQNHPASKPIEAWAAAARALVVRELLLQEARRVGLVPEPIEDAEGWRETEEEALMRALVAREVVTPQADEAACRRYYDMNRSRFRTPDLYEVRHILLAAPPGHVEARQAARQRADAIITALRREPSAFGDIARAESACPSSRTGGNLGQIGPGQTVPEFEQALASLPTGEIAPAPIESRYGFHVVVLDRRIEGRELPFEMVRARIAAWLDEKVHRVAIRQYIAILAGRAEITGIALDASATPLVQ